MKKSQIIGYDKQHNKTISKTEYNTAAACNKNSIVLNVVSSALLITVNLVMLLYAPSNLERQNSLVSRLHSSCAQFLIVRYYIVGLW
jgi:hypothetical protein